MGDSIHLIGADDVRSAGHAMKSAAEDMRSAASSFDSTLDRFTLNFQGICDQFVSELREVAQEIDLARMGSISHKVVVGDLSIQITGDPAKVSEWLRRQEITIGPKHGTADPSGDDLELQR